MGNMLPLSRYGDISAGTKGPVDNLTITYDGDGAASASVTDYRATSYVQENIRRYGKDSCAARWATSYVHEENPDQTEKKKSQVVF